MKKINKETKPQVKLHNELDDQVLQGISGGKPKALPPNPLSGR